MADVIGIATGYSPFVYPQGVLPVSCRATVLALNLSFTQEPILLPLQTEGPSFLGGLGNCVWYHSESLSRGLVTIHQESFESFI